MNNADLQVDGAEPSQRVEQVLAFADQGFERFALAAGSGVIHHRKARVIVAKLQPNNRYGPALGAFLNKV